MVKKQGEFGGYNIFAGDEPKTDILTGLRNMRQLTRGTLTNVRMPENYTEEDVGLSRMDVSVSTAFERNRAKVRDMLRAIVGFVFDKYELPLTNGVDFRCGANGEMVEELLPTHADKSKWTQFDVNPKIVRENKRRHPNSIIRVGSFHSPEHLGLNVPVDIVTGAPSLDATGFMPHAVKQISSILKPGGYLLHIQDVRPGLGAGPKEMNAMGLSEPYNIEGMQNMDGPLSFKVPHEGFVSVGELFRRRIGMIIEYGNTGFEVILNKWITAQRNLAAGNMGLIYYLNMICGTNMPEKEASAIVTLAKKK